MLALVTLFYVLVISLIIYNRAYYSKEYFKFTPQLFGQTFLEILILIPIFLTGAYLLITNT
jgi:hypothetical protein